MSKLRGWWQIDGYWFDLIWNMIWPTFWATGSIGLCVSLLILLWTNELRNYRQFWCSLRGKAETLQVISKNCWNQLQSLFWTWLVQKLQRMEIMNWNLMKCLREIHFKKWKRWKAITRARTKKIPPAQIRHLNWSISNSVKKKFWYKHNN